MTFLFIPFQGKLHPIALTFDLGDVASLKHYTIKMLIVSYLAFIANADKEGLPRPMTTFGLPFEEFVEKLTVTAAHFCGDKLQDEIEAYQKLPRSMVEIQKMLIELGYFDLNSYLKPIVKKLV